MLERIMRLIDMMMELPLEVILDMIKIIIGFTLNLRRKVIFGNPVKEFTLDFRICLSDRGKK